MATIKLSYVHSFRDRHGRMRYYYRRDGRRWPLPGRPGEPAFMAAYEEASGRFEQPTQGRGAPQAGTIDALCASYFGSAEYLSLRDSTRRTYRIAIDRWRTDHGSKRVARLERSHVSKMVAECLKARGPGAAGFLLRMIRMLMRYAVTLDWRRDDPTAGLKKPRMNSGGFRAWSEDDIAKFEAKWEKGTRERLALALLLYTGQRRGDVVRMGRQHLDGDMIRVTQGKTGAALSIPLHRELKSVIAETPKEHLTFLTTMFNRPFTAAGFGNWFRDACNAAGLAGLSAHGLRKAAATRLADAGCTAHEIASITGHKSLSEVQRYTASADQRRLAREAMKRLST